MQIFVKGLDGKTSTYEIQTWNTIRELQRKIKDQSGLPMGFQCLTYKGHNLDRQNHKTVVEAGLFKECTLHLSGRMFGGQIFLEFDNGDDEMYRWEGSFASLKTAVFKKHGIPVEKQILLCQDRIVTNDDNYKDFAVPNTLGIDMKLRVDWSTPFLPN